MRNAFCLLAAHAASLIVPRTLWLFHQAIEDDVTVEQFSGAMTNMVYRCGLQQHGQEAQVGGLCGQALSLTKQRRVSTACPPISTHLPCLPAGRHAAIALITCFDRQYCPKSL